MRSILRLALAAAVAAVALPAAATAAEFAESLKGQIVWPKDKPLPAMPALNVDKDKEHCLKNGAISSQQWVINKANNGIRYVIVSLAPIEKGATLPVDPSLAAIPTAVPTIDQPCCMFEPRVTAIREGQKVKVLNPAPVAHNISWQGTSDSRGNQIVPAGKDFTIEGLTKTKYPYSISCTIHPWMDGKIAVFDHPYFAVTDKDGKFEMPKVPAGKSKLMIWHESGWLGGKSGAQGKEIEIKPGQVNDLGMIEWKTE